VGRLLHFSPGALGIASGIILLIIAVTMVLGHQGPDGGGHPVEDQDPMQVAVFPLAVPYLLNPAGIVVLVTASAEAASVAVLAVQLALNGLSDIGVIHLAGH
jgi:multiple antibiotic resistance protein